MTERTAKETVAQAVEDFDSIKAAIMEHKIDVPYPTKTSEYAGLIAKIRVGSISGAVISGIECANTETLCGAVQLEFKEQKLRPVVGNAVYIVEYDDVIY